VGKQEKGVVTSAYSHARPKTSGVILRPLFPPESIPYGLCNPHHHLKMRHDGIAPDSEFMHFNSYYFSCGVHQQKHKIFSNSHDFLTL